MSSLVGVTSCPVGIAHTYMAAEKLEQAARKLGYDQVKIETQGASGTEHTLSQDEIDNADVIIFAADVAVAQEYRFIDKKVVIGNTTQAIKDPEKLIQRSVNAKLFTGSNKKQADSSQDDNDEHEQPAFIKQLMNGVSHMIPFVVVGGLFMALAISFGGHPTSSGMVIPKGTVWYSLNQVGNLGFTLMIPILAGFIADAIAGRAALAPVMISALVANTPEILGTKSGTGFIGAIVIGYAGGYLVKWMNSWKIPKSLLSIMPIFVIPLLGTAILSGVFIFLIGSPISWLMDLLNEMLKALSNNPSTSILLGIVMGLMVASDMGGPINKIAFLFGVASITANASQIMGIFACSGAVPPLTVGIATLIKSKNYSVEERKAALPAVLMGLIGITEGTIPSATANPKRVYPAILGGSAVAGALGAVFKITDAVPHSGPIVGVLGATNNLPLFLLIIVVGTLVGVLILTFLQERYVKKAA